MPATRLEDIANELNISVSTVSRALSGTGRVSEETRRKVLELAHRREYTVNAVARSLRLQNAKNIGFIVPDITNSFFSGVLKGAQSVCRQRDYSVMLFNSDEDVSLEERALQSLLENQVSGLIFASLTRRPRLIPQLERQGIPVVYIDNLPEALEGQDIVSVDNRLASLELTRALLRRGYKRIGTISGPKWQSSGALRYEGFCAAMEEAGLPLRPEWMPEGDFRIESGYELMKRILNERERPDAMVLGSNYLAYGAMRAIREKGLSIPQDMAVVTFDLIDETDLIRPVVTSMNQPAVQIGERAAGVLLERCEHIETPKENHVLQPSLISGGSW